MAFNPIGVARVPFQLGNQIAQNNLRVRQQEATRASVQLSTQRKFILPSDDPSASSRAIVFQSILDRNAKYLGNITAGSRTLATTEQTLKGIATAVDTGKGIGVRNAQTPVNDQELAADIHQIDQIIDDLVRRVNERYQERYVFGGQRIRETPFERDGNGIVFWGDNQSLSTLAGLEDPFNVSVTPNTSIGTDSLAGRSGDLNPDLTTATRLGDLNRGEGTARGAIEIDIGGGPVTVDLSSADNVGDVINRINSAVGAGTAAINATGDGLAINGAGPITITDIAGGTTARDLGIRAIAQGGPTFVGGDLNPRLTPTTPASALRGGLGVNLSTPIRINNGPYSATIDLSGATTIEDILNTINAADVRVRAEINDSGDGINVVNVLAGSGFEIIESSATGTAAADLGILTTNLDTPLAEFNEGRGIALDPNSADLSITLRNGTTASIDLSSAQTVRDVKSAIEAALGPGNIQVVPNPQGGIQLNDLTGGGGNFIVTNLGNGTAATDLGIAANVASASILGTQTHLARVKGIFDSLLQLREGLRQRDIDRISIASRLLSADSDRVLDAIGSVGTRLNILDTTADRLTAESEQVTRYNAEEIEPEIADAVSKLVAQSNALQVTLQSSSRLLGQSLFDFL